LQSSAGPNLLYIPANLVDSLTIVSPAPFVGLSLLGFATEGAGSMSVTVRFTDNITQVFVPIVVSDWFNIVPTPFLSGFDRVTRSTGVVGNVGSASNPRMFAFDLAITCANQAKRVKRIIIKNTTTARLCMLGVSGVLSPLTFSVTPPTLCSGIGSSTFMAAGMPTYTWLSSGSFAGSNSATIIVSPTVTTDYTLQALNISNSCLLNTVISLSVFTGPPTLSVINTSNTGICPTRTVALTASGATTYTWSGNTTVTNGLAFVPPSTADYTVTGTNACGSTSAITSVSLHPLPTVSTTASSSLLCSGGSLTLTAAGNGTAYTLSGGSGPISSEVGFVPAITTTYIAIGISALGCTASSAIPVTVIVTPIIAPVASPALVCLGKSSTLTAAASYTWSSASQTVYTTSFVVTPNLGLSTYTVIKGNSNCYNTQMITITTNSLPTIFAIVSPTIVCALQPATLAVGGGQTYTWTSSGPPTFTFTGATPQVFPSSSTTSGVNERLFFLTQRRKWSFRPNTTYSVAASDGTFISTTTVFLAANPNPTITTSASSSSVCSGKTVTVSALGGNSYTWTANSSTFNRQTIADTPTLATAYNVVGNNSFGCTAGAIRIVLVNPNPTVSIAPSKTLVCSGGAAPLTASGADTYSWDANANNVITAAAIVNPVSQVSSSMIYSVLGTYASTGCQSTSTILIATYVPVLSVTGTTNTCLGGQVSLQASGGNANTYLW